MIDWVKSLFGEGKLVYDVVLADGGKARLKIHYVGSLDSLTQNDHLESMRRCELEENVNIKSWEYKGAL